MSKKQLSEEDKELDVLEAGFIHEYVQNGENARRAYMVVRPDVTPAIASMQSSRLLKRPNVLRAYEEAKRALVVKIDKNSLLVRAGRIVDKAEDASQYSAALKGVELQGRFIGAFESGEADEEKYIQFITKISGENVTVVNNLTQDNRKVEIGG